MEDPEKIPAGDVGGDRTLGFDTVAEPSRRKTAPLPRTLEVEVVGGPMDGQVSTVRGSVVTIGRSEGNHLALGLDSTISTRHARIVREDDHYWLEDLGSRNGTYLGDERIEGRTLIGPGTIFAVGRTRLEFSPR